MALVSHGFAAEKPPLNPGPHAQVADTMVGATLVIIVESPTFSTREGKLCERCLRIRDRDVGRKEPRTKEGELNPPKNSETGRDRDRDGARVPSDRQPRCGSGDLRALRDDWTYLSVARCPSAHLLHGKVALYGLREKDFAAAELRPR